MTGILPIRRKTMYDQSINQSINQSFQKGTAAFMIHHLVGFSTMSTETVQHLKDRRALKDLIHQKSLNVSFIIFIL